MTKLSKASRQQWINWPSWESMSITKGVYLLALGNRGQVKRRNNEGGLPVDVRQ
jgi:hypothetical protein